MPAVTLTERTELSHGGRKLPALSARVEVSGFSGKFDLTRKDIEARARVEVLCPRGECPLLTRRGEVWTLSGYAPGMPRLVLPVLPVDLAGVQTPKEGDRWHRIYSVDCLVVGRPSLDDEYGLFPGGVPTGEVSLADLAAILSEGIGDFSTATFDAEGGFRLKR